MMKYIIPFIIAVSLSGCLSKPIVKQTIQEKQVPIAVFPAPPPVDKPILEIDKLTPADRLEISKVSKAMTITVEQLKRYSSRLEDVYNKYKELANTSVTIDELDPKDQKSNMEKLKEFISKHTTQ